MVNDKITWNYASGKTRMVDTSFKDWAKGDNLRMGFGL
jgi:hypothetical protein